MKRKIVLLVMTLFVSLLVLGGCASKSSDKELINKTKKDVEEVSSQIFESKRNTEKFSSSSSIIENYGSIAGYYNTMFLMLGRDMLVELEDSTKIYIEYDNGEVNGMVTGEDKTDNKKYHILIGSKNHDDLWSYATIDLDSGEISWQDNY